MSSAEEDDADEMTSDDDVPRTSKKDVEEDDDDDDALPDDDDDNAERLNQTGASKFAAAIKALTAAAPVGQGVQVLRKTKMMKQLDAERRASKMAKLARDERKEFDNKGLRKLPETDPALINRERDLRRIATRGVVALFNAIGTHQVAKAPLAKDEFEDLLKNGASKKKPSAAVAAAAVPTTKTSTSAWKALQDDYADDMSSDGTAEAPVGAEAFAAGELDDDELEDEDEMTSPLV